MLHFTKILATVIKTGFQSYSKIEEDALLLMTNIYDGLYWNI